MVADPVRAAAALLSEAQDVTLLAHVQPDADSLGSALALAISLHRLDIPARVAFAAPEAMPEGLRRLDVHGLVVPPSEVPARPDVLVSCDAAEPSRLGDLADRLDTSRAVVMLDHHVSNPGFGDVRILDPDAEATVVLAHRVLVAMGAPLHVDVARCLYAGLYMDTGGLRRAGTGALRLAARLVAAGVDGDAVVRPIMNSHPYGWLAALGTILGAAVLEPDEAGGRGLVHAAVLAGDVERFRQEEVDSVIDVVSTTAEAEVAVVLKQVGERRWSSSMRSLGAVDVAAVAGRLGGGGHRGAAGFTRDGTLDEIRDEVRNALRAETR
ncbi:MAG: DHH family phosphoesterase [Pseudonocardiales bacterium]|nr:DHH family phosphoesterase [Pseudonocardiales bacterium]